MAAIDGVNIQFAGRHQNAIRRSGHRPDDACDPACVMRRNRFRQTGSAYARLTPSQFCRVDDPTYNIIPAENAFPNLLPNDASGSLLLGHHDPTDNVDQQARKAR